ncbi:MAG: DUF1566 domain-containing protein [Nitrospirae bacterium]|nr:DUF1566 domain-containing protein [Nitrospirota bacterium]
MISEKSMVSTINLPQTGQTTCYDSDGNKIACAGTGQDGDIKAGVAWPNPRFTDNGDQTITDKLTGLMWTKNANLAGEKTWQQALDYVTSMNTGSGTYGYTDWRLPNRKELRSPVDYSRYDAALPAGNPFTNVKSMNCYLSSTTRSCNTCDAWCVWESGGVTNSFKSTSYDVRPVRSGHVGNLVNSVISHSGNEAHLTSAR